MITDVYSFNQFTLRIPKRSLDRLPEEEKRWLLMALREEVNELESSQSLEEDVDALIDLIYFAIGGFYRLGLSSGQVRAAFKAVHEVNKKKKAGVKPTRPQDGSVTDAIKPDDLPDPLLKIKEILIR